MLIRSPVEHNYYGRVESVTPSSGKFARHQISKTQRCGYGKKKLA